MKRTVVGKWCIGVASALFALYLVVIGIRIKTASDFILIPHPWVRWLVVPFLVLAVLGVILTNWVSWRKKTSASPSSASVDLAPMAGPTYITNVNGRANISQGSNGVDQTNISAPNTPIPNPPNSGRGSVRGPWTEHAGLRCHKRIISGVRPVVWISNGAPAGELHPAARGPKLEVYSSMGELLGKVDDMKPGMSLLRVTRADRNISPLGLRQRRRVAVRAHSLFMVGTHAAATTGDPAETVAAFRMAAGELATAT